MDSSWTMTFDDDGMPQIESLSMDDSSSYTTAISSSGLQLLQRQNEEPTTTTTTTTTWSSNEDEYCDEYYCEEEEYYYDVASREHHDDGSDENFHDAHEEEQNGGGGGRGGLRNSFYDLYQLGELLGSGGYGSVYRCTLRESARLGLNPFAVKIVRIENYNDEEIMLMNKLIDCPNVTGLIDLFFDKTIGEVYIVMEEMQGGDLLDRIHDMEGGSYEEQDAKILIRTLLETLRFCHSRGIVHMDIKPDNILLRTKEDPTDMELADFGLAQRFLDHNGNRIRLTKCVGTVEYWAPEIIMVPDDDDLNDDDDDDDDVVGYDERVDVWSVGVVMYVLLGGYLPFNGDTEDDIMEQVCSGCFEFHEPYWSNISDEAKDLITMMLQVNPDERCSVDEALESRWFQEASTCPRFGTC